MKRETLAPFENFPMKAVTAALLFTMALFLTTGWHIWKSYRDYREAPSREYRCQILINTLNSGPELTGIARRMATEGNLDSMDRYKSLSGEVSEAITELVGISPDYETRDLAQKLEMANRTLFDLENRAFSYIRQGSADKARQLLSSREYSQNLDMFDSCNHLLDQKLQKIVMARADSLRTRAFFAFAAIVVSVPALVFVWLIVLGMMKRHLRERRFQEWRHQVFSSLEQKLSEVSTPREAAWMILNKAGELFGWDSCYLVFYSEDEGKFYTVLNIDTVEGEKKEYPPLEKTGEMKYPGFIRVLETGPYLILRSAASQIEDLKLIPFGDVERTSASLMFVPIRKGGRNVGALSIQSYSENAYQSGDLELLEDLADRGSGALDRTFTEQKLHQQELFTRTLSDLGKNIAAATTPKEAGIMVLETADELFGWDAAYVNFFNPEGDVFDVVTFDIVDGQQREVPAAFEQEGINMVARRILKEGPQLILRGSSPEKKKGNLFPFGDKEKQSASLIFTPIRKGDRTVGVISIQSYSRNAYNEDDLRRFQILADHCSGAFERTVAEVKLSRSEEKLRLLTEQIPTLLWTTDKNLRFTLLHGAGLTGLDLEPGGFLGKSLFDFFETSEPGFPPIARHRQALEGQSSHYEMERMGRFFDSYVEPLKDDAGNIMGCICVAHDVTDRILAEEALVRAHEELEQRVEERTAELLESNALLKNEIQERKRAENELEHSLSLLRATLESTTDGILGVTIHGILANWNRKFVDMWNLPADLMRKGEFKPVEDVILDQLSPSSDFRQKGRVLEPPHDQERFDVLELKDGRIFESYLRPQWIGKKCVGRVLSFRDVTERRRGEEAIERSEAIYREAIANASGVPYRLIYEQNNYDFVGEGILPLLGFAPGEFTFDLLQSLIREVRVVDPDAPPDHQDYVIGFQKGELDQYRADLLLHTRTGEEKWVSDCSVPVRDEKSGRVIGSLGILQDITKRKMVEEQARQQQEQLVQADKMVALGTLVSGVAHEINNPNNFIMLNTPVLLEAWENIEPILDEYYRHTGDFSVAGLYYSEMREHIPVLFSGIVDGCKRIKSIVQELRDFARRHPAEEMGDVDINNVVKSALNLILNMIRQYTDNFDVRYGTDLPLLRGNFQRLEQVVINLIQNACQSLSAPRKKVVVSTGFDRKTSSVIVQVHDEGTGISEDRLKQITDPFYTTKRDTGGTGLGLSISQNIVNEHGGELKFSSTPGKGTTVRFVLPVNRMKRMDEKGDKADA